MPFVDLSIFLTLLSIFLTAMLYLCIIVRLFSTHLEGTVLFVNKKNQKNFRAHPDGMLWAVTTLAFGRWEWGAKGLYRIMRPHSTQPEAGDCGA